MNPHDFRKSALLWLGAALLVPTSLATAQPRWGAESSPTPSAGASTSQKANAAADRAVYKPVEYANAGRKGPAVIVLPGEIKSNNATFTQKFTPNNIADFAELELGKANFQVLDAPTSARCSRNSSSPTRSAIREAARKFLKKGKLKTTKWVVKFDILKAEQVAPGAVRFRRPAIGGACSASSRLGGGARPARRRAPGRFGPDRAKSTGVWIIGMRYKIIDANTTEQVATGYTEEKMELGAKSTAASGRVANPRAGRPDPRRHGAAPGAEAGLGNRQRQVSGGRRRKAHPGRDTSQ